MSNFDWARIEQLDNLIKNHKHNKALYEEIDFDDPSVYSARLTRFHLTNQYVDTIKVHERVYEAEVECTVTNDQLIDY